MHDDHSLDSEVAMFVEDVVGAGSLVLVTMTESLHEVMEEESLCEESYFYGCQFFLCDQDCQDHNFGTATYLFLPIMNILFSDA